MKTQHTPGPWKSELVKGHENNLVYCRITSVNFEHPGGIAYANIPLKGKTVKQKELAGLYARQGEQLAQANARLIAAAPELLEQLNDALTRISEAIRNEDIPLDLIPDKVLTKWEKAIQKATQP